MCLPETPFHAAGRDSQTSAGHSLLPVADKVTANMFSSKVEDLIWCRLSVFVNIGREESFISKGWKLHFFDSSDSDVTFSLQESF